ncbi:MAG: ATP-binding protein [Desulfobulbaceae bacterium]|nr:ATP-binding protein [Desulfobulbaceae bacterium]
MAVIQVPTINDHAQDFDRLFDLWNRVNGDSLEVVFDFSSCNFIRQNGVAFLGGLARLIQYRQGRVDFKWGTLQRNIFTNLAQNGFLAAFGFPKSAWLGNSIPYREDSFQDKDAVINYLKTRWIGHKWVQAHISERLQDSMIGKVWEIYANAFEHGQSPTGVFSCGQYYPDQQELKLTVVDFGIGIPAKVRLHFRHDPRALHISASNCLQWAFKRGHSTGTEGISRGVGLDLLKEFVKINKGGLDLFSHEGCARVDEKIDMVANRTSFFEGTLVNITLKCDESFYHFSDETVEGPLF